MQPMKTMVIVLVLLGTAIYYDFRTDKVPNRLILTGYLTGAVLSVHAPPDLIHFIVSALWPIVLLYPLFLIRGLGAGDIKLFSVLSIFYSSTILIRIMILSVFIGAVISIISWFTNRFLTKTVFRHYIHYTLCIFLAFVIESYAPGVCETILSL